ncbi:c-type cytochrome [Parasphingorhabdus sp.]|uniref:c-type cytochrome n=1 Tax=Parasphingorhabdus sp. TaxID=2709688 RepID=UPI003A91AFF0
MIKARYPYVATAAVFAVFILAGCDGNSGKNGNNAVDSANRGSADQDMASGELPSVAKLADGESNVAASLSSKTEAVPANIAEVTTTVIKQEAKQEAKQESRVEAAGTPRLISALVAAKAEPAVAAAPPAAFAQCAVCHSVKASGASGIGPNLHGVYGGKAGTRSGYSYSPAMVDSGIQWTRAKLDSYLADPKGLVPGTRMVVPGVADAAKRKDIIDYLEANK